MRQPPLFQAALVSACFVIAAEGVSRAVVQKLSANSHSANHNPYARIFWIAYTERPKKVSDERTIVVITNSQGHLRQQEGSLGYPALMESALGRTLSGGALVVANWPIRGGHAPEMTVLAARASSHQPAAVIFSVYSQNFSDVRPGRALAAARNDIDLLAYLPQVRRNLSPWFVREFRLNSPRGWLSSRSGLLELHEAGATFMAGWRRATGEDVAEALDEGRRQISLTRAEPWSAYSDRLLEELFETAHRALPQAALFFVSMPLDRERFARDTWPHARELASRLNARLGGQPGVRVLDAVELIEPRFFTDDTHMAPEGHRQYAQWLLGHVTPVLR